MTRTNKHGEVIDIPDISQFEVGESDYECVAFSVAMCHYGTLPGTGPISNLEAIDQVADQWYTKFTGDNNPSNDQGLTLAQEEEMIEGLGNGWFELPISPTSPHDRDISFIKSAVSRGYPVLACGAETSMFDMGIGDRVPYQWTPAGNHCIVITGIAPSGNFLVRDPANVVVNIPRPGPRVYDISRLDLISGIAFIPDWMQPKIKIPAGWKDDGTTLTAPNLMNVTGKFREKIIGDPHWQPENMPLMAAEANPYDGTDKQWQVFLKTILHEDEHDGVTETWGGPEVIALLIKLRGNTAASVST